MSADPSSPLLPDLDPADHDALSAAGSGWLMARGATLYAQGDDSAPVLFVRGGLLRASAGLADGDGVLAGLIGPGDAAGLATALSEAPASHSAVALTEVSGLAVEGRRLRRLAAERPSLALALSSAVSRQLAQAHEQLACHARHRVEHRLAQLLLRLRDTMPDGGLPITQDELAQMLAVQRTTVTALAYGLKDAGLIAYSRGSIRIVDAERLGRLACDHR